VVFNPFEEFKMEGLDEGLTLDLGDLKLVYDNDTKLKVWDLLSTTGKNKTTLAQRLGITDLTDISKLTNDKLFDITPLTVESLLTGTISPDTLINGTATKVEISEANLSSLLFPTTESTVFDLKGVNKAVLEIAHVDIGGI
jgi:DNA-binding Xre family transcriptional regulator